MTPKEVIKFAKEKKAVCVDLKFIDFLGIWQHFTIPMSELERGAVRGRPRLRRLVDPRLAADQRVRHAGRARPDHGGDGPVLRRPTLSLICNIVDPITKEELLARPAQHRQEGRGVPEVDRHRRHRLLRSGAGVLHPRRHPLRPELAQRLLLPRLGRGRLEHAAARKARTSATSRATRKATSRCRRPTRSRTSAARWC